MEKTREKIRVFSRVLIPRFLLNDSSVGGHLSKSVMVNIVSINRGRSSLTVHFVSIFLRKYVRLDLMCFSGIFTTLGSRNNLSLRGKIVWVNSGESMPMRRS